MPAEEARHTWAKAHRQDQQAVAIAQMVRSDDGKSKNLAIDATARQGKPMTVARRSRHMVASFVEWFAEEANTSGETIPGHQPAPDRDR
jgi:hypothetical protein